MGPSRSRRLSRGAVAAVVGLALAAVVGAASLSFVASDAPALTLNALTTLPGTTCPVFPHNNVWNTPINALPVNAQSATWLAAIASSGSFLHPDFGPSADPRHPYGIPWVIVAPRTPFTTLHFQYASESDRRPYPLTATTPIEGGSDRHALMVDPTRSVTSPACTLFETFATYYRANGRSQAGSGATWNLRSNALRPAGFTSGDAAGLPILPGLVNFSEVAAGAMTHALRFTVQCTNRAYVWPARHQAGQANPNCPPMGARFRLNATFSLPASACGTFCQTVVRTMKIYGLIVADNGSNWYFQGTADRRWTVGEVNQLKQIPANQFVAVDESCLIVNPNSAQAWQPESLAYAQRCRGTLP